MLPGLGPSPGKILTAAYKLGSLKDHVLPLLARRPTRGILEPARSSRGGRDGRHIVTGQQSPGIDLGRCRGPARCS
jgi:hypothetical protein